MEIEAPPSRKEEAVFIEPDGSILVTAEGVPAPLYRISLAPENP